MKQQPDYFSFTGRMVHGPQFNFRIYEIIVFVSRAKHYPIDMCIMKPVIHVHHGIDILGG